MMSHTRPDQKISRVHRSKDAAKLNYDRISHWYDLITGSSEWQFTRAGLNLLNVQPGESVLEIGYGTGKAISALSHAVGPGGCTAGIDISSGMMAVTQKRLQAGGVLNDVDLRCGDALHLPFPPTSFDAVFISFTLELFDTPEIPLLLAECLRVLHADGRINIVALSNIEPKNMVVRLYNWAHRFFPNFIDCRPINTRESVLQAGFLVHDTHLKKMWGLPVDIILAYKKI